MTASSPAEAVEASETLTPGWRAAESKKSASGDRKVDVSPSPEVEEELQVESQVRTRSTGQHLMNCFLVVVDLPHGRGGVKRRRKWDRMGRSRGSREGETPIDNPSDQIHPKGFPIHRRSSRIGLISAQIGCSGAESPAT